MGNSDFSSFLESSQRRINQYLADCLPPDEGPASRLCQAMRYSVLNGGKRIRPVLSYAAAYAVGDINRNTDRVAAAVELIHAYSLIHDDLPAMDDDELRRGNPTCHIAYDEATAILAGDALQTLAFSQLAAYEGGANAAIQLVRNLADAAGASGMVAGQEVDISAVGKQLELVELEAMHHLKTGAMIAASISMGAIATGAVDNSQLAALAQYGSAIGLAFQVQDDILDVESNTETLGKCQGADRALHKPTYTSLLGLTQAKEKAAQLHQASLEALSSFDHRADHLRNIANYIITRNH